MGDTYGIRAGAFGGVDSASSRYLARHISM